MTITKIATEGPMTTRRRNPKVGKDTEEEETGSIERKGGVDRKIIGFGKREEKPIGGLKLATGGGSRAPARRAMTRMWSRKRLG